MITQAYIYVYTLVFYYYYYYYYYHYYYLYVSLSGCYLKGQPSAEGVHLRINNFSF